MANSAAEHEQGRSLEFGLASDARLASRYVWSLWKSGTSAYAEVRSHPLGHQLCVHMDGSLLFTSVHLTREDAEREARELRQGALAEGWMDPKNPLAGGLALVPGAGGHSEA